MPAFTTSLGTLLVSSAMTIKDLRKIEGLAKIIQVYSTRAQALTNQTESSKLEEILRSSIKELSDYIATLPMPAVVVNTSADEDAGICESCQG